jgi:hypothetical protein
MGSKDFFDLRNQLSERGYIKVGSFEADFGDVVKVVEQELFEEVFKLQNCAEHQERAVICEILRLLENAVDEVAREAWRHADVDFDAA